MSEDEGSWWRKNRIAGLVIYGVMVGVALYLVAVAAGIPLPSLLGARGPALTIRPSAVDFGRVGQRATVQRALVLENRGDQPLELRSVRSPTPALSIAVAQRTIGPGDQQVLRLRLVPVGLSGEQKFLVGLTTNEAGQKQWTVLVAATVDHAIRRRPGLRMEQELFDVSCRGCHLEPSAGKTGASLFAAVCACCHGARGQGTESAPRLRNAAKQAPEGVRVRVRDRVVLGLTGTAMPAWGREAGGYLGQPQIGSLVGLIEGWQTAKGSSR